MADDEEQLASPDIADVERLVRAKTRHKRLLLSKPGVIGMDIGYRVRRGQPTDERVVKVYVSQKLDKDELAPTTSSPRRSESMTKRSPSMLKRARSLSPRHLPFGRDLFGEVPV